MDIELYMKLYTENKLKLSDKYNTKNTFLPLATLNEL